MYTLKIIFWQRPEIEVTKCLIVQGLSSSYVLSFYLAKEWKATQQWSLCVTNKTAQPGQYIMSVCRQRLEQILVRQAFFLSTPVQTHC